MKINIRKRKDFSIFLTIFFTTELVELTLARCEEDSQLRSLSLEDSESVRRTHESQLRSLSLEDSEEWVFFFKVKKNNKLSKSKLLKSLIPESLNKTETPKP